MAAETKTKPEIFIEYRGVKVPKSAHIIPGIANEFETGIYESQEADGVIRIVGPKDRVLECGCGLGVVSAIAAVHGKPEAVLSFEANPTLIDDIKALHKVNKLSKKMTVENALLVSDPDAPPSMTFHVHRNFLGSQLRWGGKRSHAVEVPTRQFSAVKEEFRPTVLVMDIEGAELDFLRHADLSGIRAAVIEFHPRAYNIAGMRECKRILTQAGFQRLDCSTRTVWTMERAA